MWVFEIIEKDLVFLFSWKERVRSFGIWWEIPGKKSPLFFFQFEKMGVGFV